MRILNMKTNIETRLRLLKIKINFDSTEKFVGLNCFIADEIGHWFEVNSN